MSYTKQSRRFTLLKWTGTILSVLLLIYLLSQQDWQAVKQALSQVPVWRFVVAFLLMLVSRFLVASRWYALLRVISTKVRWSESVRLTFAGLFATNFLPTTIGGDIIRLAGAVQYELDAAETTASLVTDRLVGMFGMALMIPFGFVPLAEWFSLTRNFSELSLPTEKLMISVVGVKKIWKKITNFVIKTLRSTKLWLDQPSSLFNSFLFTLIHMVCFFGIFWILLEGLNDPIPYLTVAGLYSFVYLVTLLPISINGYGLQELSISVIFSEVGGISLQNGLTIAIIFRTMTMLASLPGAFFLPSIISGSKNENDAIDDDTSLKEYIE